MLRGGEPGHVYPAFGEDDLSAVDADAGDLGEALHGGASPRHAPRRLAAGAVRVVGGMRVVGVPSSASARVAGGWAGRR